MENSSRLSQWLTSAQEYLNRQVWYNELRAKWEEVDPQSRIYMKIAAALAIVLIGLISLITALWSLHSLKKSVAERKALLQFLNSANDEVRRLRDVIPANLQQEGGGKGTGGAGGGGGGAEGGWIPYFEGLAGGVGLEKSNIAIAPGQTLSPADLYKEALFQVTLKHVNIKQIVRFIVSLESGSKPVKLRNLAIDTKNDPSGYLQADLAVSAFTITVQK